MKNKGLLITTLIFFLAINTTYYWEGKLGLFTFPAFLILIIIYLSLAIVLAGQIYLSVKEKLANKTRLINISILTTVLTLTFFRPHGIVDFENFESNDILIAAREGAANCTTTLRLKDDFNFKERTVCFGITETKGTYRLQNDTIFFENVSIARHHDEFYKFAVVKRSKFNKDKKHYHLRLYKSQSDTTGHELWITKNHLNKLKKQNPVSITP